jgi:hypothetical protein
VMKGIERDWVEGCCWYSWAARTHLYIAVCPEGDRGEEVAETGPPVR